MPADEALRTFAAKVGAPPRREEPEPDTCDDCEAFRCLRGRDRAMMLAFHFRNGNVDAFAYSWLERLSYDASLSVVLSFGREKVTICGRNLNRELQPGMQLIDAILRHKVTVIRESSKASLHHATSTDLSIESITIGD